LGEEAIERADLKKSRSVEKKLNKFKLEEQAPSDSANAFQAPSEPANTSRAEPATSKSDDQVKAEEKVAEKARSRAEIAVKLRIKDLDKRKRCLVNLRISIEYGEQDVQKKWQNDRDKDFVQKMLREKRYDGLAYTDPKKRAGQKKKKIPSKACNLSVMLATRTSMVRTDADVSPRYKWCAETVI
jgi:hypothetical protein